MPQGLVTAEARADGMRRALRLEYFTVGWNVVEGVVAIASGAIAGSIALVGFGLDSYIEVAAACVVIWRLRKHGDEGDEEAAERRAVMFIGATLLALALYVAFESAKKLMLFEAPSESVVGIVLAALSLAVMPLLAWRKRKVAHDIGSRALAADAVETFVCSYLSLTLLLGLGLNALLGWWWADPVAGLAMVPFIAREGWEAIEERREGTR
jgi:divalent metal cation (Fe/Co/Zn/Cd) transporter